MSGLQRCKHAWLAVRELVSDTEMKRAASRGDPATGAADGAAPRAASTSWPRSRPSSFNQAAWCTIEEKRRCAPFK